MNQEEQWGWMRMMFQEKTAAWGWAESFMERHRKEAFTCSKDQEAWVLTFAEWFSKEVCQNSWGCDDLNRGVRLLDYWGQHFPEVKKWADWNLARLTLDEWFKLGESLVVNRVDPQYVKDAKPSLGWEKWLQSPWFEHLKTLKEEGTMPKEIEAQLSIIWGHRKLKKKPRWTLEDIKKKWSQNSSLKEFDWEAQPWSDQDQKLWDLLPVSLQIERVIHWIEKPNEYHDWWTESSQWYEWLEKVNANPETEKQWRCAVVLVDWPDKEVASDSQKGLIQGWMKWLDRHSVWVKEREKKERYEREKTAFHPEVKRMSDEYKLHVRKRRDQKQKEKTSKTPSLPKWTIGSRYWSHTVCRLLNSGWHEEGLMLLKALWQDNYCILLKKSTMDSMEVNWKPLVIGDKKIKVNFWLRNCPKTQERLKLIQELKKSLNWKDYKELCQLLGLNNDKHFWIEKTRTPVKGSLIGWAVLNDNEDALKTMIQMGCEAPSLDTLKNWMVDKKVIIAKSIDGGMKGITPQSAFLVGEVTSVAQEYNQWKESVKDEGYWFSLIEKIKLENSVKKVDDVSFNEENPEGKTLKKTLRL